MSTGHEVVIPMEDTFTLTIPVDSFILYKSKDSMSRFAPQNTRFAVDTAFSKTVLEEADFGRFTEWLKGDAAVLSSIDKICSQLLSCGGAVLNETHLCEGLVYEESRPLGLSQLEEFTASNMQMDLGVRGGSVFSFRSLWVLQPNGEKIEYEYQEETLKIRSLKVGLGFARGKRNAVGMNFLDKKSVYVDYQLLQMKVSECVGRGECEPKTVTTAASSMRAVRIGIDILVFVLFISLIFGAIISFDKFINEDEYLKD